MATMTKTMCSIAIVTVPVAAGSGSAQMRTVTLTWTWTVPPFHRPRLLLLLLAGHRTGNAGAVHSFDGMELVVTWTLLLLHC